jgi:DNA-binding NarL/FixJ family response regulator
LATSSIRVLVIDDSEPFRRVVCSMLQNKLEFRNIVEASDGVEAIELAQALQPELILLDIGPQSSTESKPRGESVSLPRNRKSFLSAKNLPWISCKQLST